MTSLVLLTLATFWAWETFRFLLLEYQTKWYGYTRALHPFLVLSFPLFMLWPDYVSAMAVAGTVGLIHQIVSRFLVIDGTPSTVVPRGRRSVNLPRLP